VAKISNFDMLMFAVNNEKRTLEVLRATQNTRFFPNASVYTKRLAKSMRINQ